MHVLKFRSFMLIFVLINILCKKQLQCLLRMCNILGMLLRELFTFFEVRKIVNNIECSSDVATELARKA